MPRKLRLEFPGAMYHVMSRGDQREDIFLCDVDRYDFLKTLAEACRRTGWQVHAFCFNAEELTRLQWSQQDLAARSKSDPRKLAIAARLRQETTLSIKQIAERLHLGKPKGAKTNLHKSLNRAPRLTSELELGL